MPGVRISELMPLTARQMHRMALVRGVNTKEDDHGKGQYLMQTGRPRDPGPGVPAPGLGGRQVPGVRAKPAAGLHPHPAGRRRAERREAAFLGPKYGSLSWATARPRPIPRARLARLTAGAAGREVLRHHSTTASRAAPDGGDRRIHHHL